MLYGTIPPFMDEMAFMWSPENIRQSESELVSHLGAGSRKLTVLRRIRTFPRSFGTGEQVVPETFRSLMYRLEAGLRIQFRS